MSSATPTPPITSSTSTTPAIPTINDPAVLNTMQAAQKAFRTSATLTVTVNDQPKTIPYPYPSPTDWRETWIYLLMTDRFNNQTVAPADPWNQRSTDRQGGTFKGIEAQLGYIAGLGARAIWLTPVLKNLLRNAPPFNYHGYATQDFLTIDGRFASDGTSATAATELTELIRAAHARGIYIILDIVLNHSAEVFKYLYQGQLQDSFNDPAILYGSLGDEPPILWMDAAGNAQPLWQNTLPATGLGADDVVWPQDLQEHFDFFRRRGNILTSQPPSGGFIEGDFGSMRQLVHEYITASPAQAAIRQQYGEYPVINILIRIYSYLIAAFDIDAFRIDTVMYVEPDMIQTFGNAIREFALSIGKANFFMFGEIDDSSDPAIAQFVGRNTSDINGNGLGIDAAVDYPLFDLLPNVIKELNGSDVAAIRQLFESRKTAEESRITSHGEAGKYFVSFLDNHDQNQRFNTPTTPTAQVLMGLAVLFSLQGIPCLYYGTEQGLTGAKNADGSQDTMQVPECVREALWGKTPSAFDNGNPYYLQIASLGQLRASETALQYGRLYFREVSGNGKDFGQSGGIGGIIAFSRILFNREILTAANTSTTSPFEGFIVMDLDINWSTPAMTVAYSNLNTPGTGSVQIIENANFYNGPTLTGSGDTAALFVKLAPMEVQILTPVGL